MTKEANIAHESEVQRQHVRLQLPVNVGIAGKVFSAEDWSHSGVAICWEGAGVGALGLGDNVKEGKHFDATLNFDFDGYNFSMDVKCEVRFINASKKRMGCRFDQLTTQQVSLLKYFVSAYMAGEVVRAGDIMDVAARNNFTKSRKVPLASDDLSSAELASRKAKRFFWSGLVMLVSVSCFVYLVMAIYERTYVVKASSAVVTADMDMVQSPAGGQVVFQTQQTNIDVQKGAPLFSVETLTGSVVGKDSPYEGAVKRYLAKNGDTVRKGQALVGILPDYATPYIIAEVPFERAVRLAVGSNAVLEFEGYGETTDGVVTRLEMFEGQRIARVEIQPINELTVRWVDLPVAVSFDTFSKPSAKAVSAAANAAKGK